MALESVPAPFSLLLGVAFDLDDVRLRLALNRHALANALHLPALIGEMNVPHRRFDVGVVHCGLQFSKAGASVMRAASECVPQVMESEVAKLQPDQHTTSSSPCVRTLSGEQSSMGAYY